MELDRPALTEVVVTPAMIEAGVSVLDEVLHDPCRDPYRIAQLVFKVMRAAS